MDNKKNNKQSIQIRNSTQDFLVFSKENGGDGVDVLVADENVWLTQKSICALYDVAKSTISEHLSAIFASGELEEDSVVRNFRTTATDGNRMDGDALGDTVHHINMLTVIASESYRDFVGDLQKQIKEVLYDRPTKATIDYFKGKTIFADGYQ